MQHQQGKHDSTACLHSLLLLFSHSPFPHSTFRPVLILVPSSFGHAFSKHTRHHLQARGGGGDGGDDGGGGKRWCGGGGDGGGDEGGRGVTVVWWW